MKKGDLVRFVWSNPNDYLFYESSLGIVISIVDQYLVEVLWAGRDYTYLESVQNLEVMNEAWGLSEEVTSAD